MSDYIKYVTNNKQAIQESSECGCVSCLTRYNPSITKIQEWVDADNTAVCPLCGIDTVVPNSLVQYTDADLARWNQQGF